MALCGLASTRAWIFVLFSGSRRLPVSKNSLKRPMRLLWAYTSQQSIRAFVLVVSRISAVAIEPLCRSCSMPDYRGLRRDLAVFVLLVIGLLAAVSVLTFDPADA